MIVDRYMPGKIEINLMITLTPPLDRIDEGFDPMREGESCGAVAVR
jgi:Zn-dependent alcohol dehydrogenase